MLMIIILILKCNAAIRKWQAYRNIYIEGHSNCTLRWFPFPFHFLAASAASELIANRSTPTDESVAKPHPPATFHRIRPLPRPPSSPAPFGRRMWRRGRRRSTGGRGSIRWPFPGRRERDAASGRRRRIRWTAAVCSSRGIPPRTSSTAPSIPICIRRTSTAPG